MFTFPRFWCPVAKSLFLALWITTLGRSEGVPSWQVAFPPDSPVALAGANWDMLQAEPRAGALVVHARASLSLRNVAQRPIRSVTLLVLTQEVAPGGRATVSVPGLNARPGQVFPVRIDLRLLAPVNLASSCLVRIELDGVLFDDLSFYGPDRTECRRSMVAWELEARRDRRYFRQILETEGREGLRRALLASLARQDSMSRATVRVVPAARATNLRPDVFELAFVALPQAPVELVEGTAIFTGGLAQMPRIRVRNRSSRPVRYLEIGWVCQDGAGTPLIAGSVPSKVDLAPGQWGEVSTRAALQIPGRFRIARVAGFLRQVEFADGQVWIPDRNALDQAGLGAALPSPEEQRLVELYRKRGLGAVIEQLWTASGEAP